MRFAAAILWAIAWCLVGMPWDGSVDEFNLPPTFWKLYPSSARQLLDAALNVMFYVPLGAVMPLLGLTPLLTFALGILLSAATELLQLFSPTRYATLTDVVFNTVGVAVGLGLCARRNKRQRA